MQDWFLLFRSKKDFFAFFESFSSENCCAYALKTKHVATASIQWLNEFEQNFEMNTTRYKFVPFSFLSLF